MGATTRSGRTRNRRAISPAGIPAGYPVLCPPFQITSTGPRNISFQLIDVTGNTLTDLKILEGATLSMFEANTSTVIDIPMSYDSGTQEAVLAFPSDHFTGEPFFVFAWQLSLRGPEGEWCPSFILIWP